MTVWLYYFGAIALLVANLAAWLSNFVRLPGNWIIVCNSILFLCLLPAREDGLGIGLFGVCLLAALAVFGDSFNFVVRRQRRLGASVSGPIRKQVLVGASIGSVTFVVAGLAVPVIGSMLSVIGALIGAAGGAWLGSVVPITRDPGSKVDLHADIELQPHPILSRLLTESQIKLLPRISTGFVMVMVSVYASLI